MTKKWEWERFHGIPVMEEALKRLKWVLDCHDSESFPKEAKRLRVAIRCAEQALKQLKEKTE